MHNRVNCLLAGVVDVVFCEIGGKEPWSVNTFLLKINETSFVIGLVADLRYFSFAKFDLRSSLRGHLMNLLMDPLVSPLMGPLISSLMGYLMSLMMGPLMSPPDGSSDEHNDESTDEDTLGLIK